MNLSIFKNGVVAGGVFLFLFTVIPTVRADMLVGALADSAIAFNVTYKNAEGESLTRKATEIPEMLGTNKESKQVLQYFCANFSTNLSLGFMLPTRGQEYEATDLVDAPLNAAQQGAIQTLLNHTFGVLLDAQNVLANAGDDKNSLEWNQARDAVDILDIAIQAAVWEIIHETEVSEGVLAGEWDVLDGSFHVSNPTATNNFPYSDLNPTQALTQIGLLTSGWFEGVLTGNWDEQFAAERLFEVSYFASVGSLSQPLIGVMGEASCATSEPASFWIMGLGVIGISLLRRKKRNPESQQSA